MRLSRLIASAAVGGLVVLCTSVAAGGQSLQPVGTLAAIASGSIHGTVQDEKGAPVPGAIVSALGATTQFVQTDRSGRFELRTLSPGNYHLRAHLSGFVASRDQIVQVRPSGRTQSSIAIRRIASDTSSSHVLAAGAGLGSPETPAATPASPVNSVSAVNDVASAGNDDHSETAWRLRHARRGVLKDATMPDAIIADGAPESSNIFAPINFFGRSVGSSARLATSLFSGTPWSGQVNLLTTGTFDTPQQLFSIDSFSRGVAFLSVSTPAGASADWTMRGALTQGDIASWIVAGSYLTRKAARHRYDIGLSYATQRYEGGNPAALRDVRDGSRNAGAIYGFDTFTISPAVAVTYGARYARYDYLLDRGAISPRLGLTVVPAEGFRVGALLTARTLAPGAEEFLPPGDTGIWLPPQRTFSSLDGRMPLAAERATHFSVEVERDLGAASAVTFRAFRQHVNDQLVTMFGVDVPGAPSAQLGHYFVGNSGDLDATGWSAGVRAALADRFRGSVQYSQARAEWAPRAGVGYMVLLAPSALRQTGDRIHDLSTSVETEVPETATRVMVLYRLSNGFAHPAAGGASSQPSERRPMLDSRFDVQVRQSLPFMNFSAAHWEMLLAVHNFFREVSAEQSLYDELLVVRPPKRVIGGLTLRF